MSGQKQIHQVAYSPPKLIVLGSLHELTMAGKIGMKTDGVFLYAPIVNASP